MHLKVGFDLAPPAGIGLESHTRLREGLKALAGWWDLGDLGRILEPLVEEPADPRPHAPELGERSALGRNRFGFLGPGQRGSGGFAKGSPPVPLLSVGRKSEELG
jgi:hypothetical protein